jgi:hypothetical protein
MMLRGPVGGRFEVGGGELVLVGPDGAPARDPIRFHEPAHDTLGEVVDAVNRSPGYPWVAVLGGYEFWVDDDGTGTGRNYPHGPFADDDRAAWRVEVRPAIEGSEHRFLHVLQAAIDDEPEIACSRLATSDGELEGAWIPDRSVVVWFRTGPGAVMQATLPAPAGRVRHIVTGLDPGRTYSRRRDEGASVPQRCSPAGVLDFVTESPVAGEVDLVQRRVMSLAPVSAGEPSADTPDRPRACVWEVRPAPHGSMQVAWWGANGLAYTVEFCDEPSGGAWQPVADSAAVNRPGADRWEAYLDASASGFACRRRFYRVRCRSAG